MKNAQSQTRKEDTEAPPSPGAGASLWESLTSRRSLYRDSSQSSRAVARFSMAVTVVQ